MIVNVEAPDMLTLVGLNVKEKPAGLVADRPIVPVKPLTAVTFTVDVPELPV